MRRIKMSNNVIERLFNSHKIRYALLDKYIEYDKEKQRMAYMVIDLEYLLSKFLYNIGYMDIKDLKITEEDQNMFIAGLLNVISHYKNYFFKYMDALSFFYISINNKKYKRDKQISNMIKRLISIVLLIPRVNIYYYENGEQNYFLKYNLIRTILITRKTNETEQLFFNIGKPYMSELFYRLTQKYYTFNFEADDNEKIYSFKNFRDDYLHDIDPVYIGPIISLLSVYTVLEEIRITRKVRIDDVILKFIKTHMDDDFNSLTTKLLVLKLFTNMKRLEKKLINLENNLNSHVYQTMIQTIMENWRRVVKDRSVYNINEMLKIPHTRRINIEILMNS